MAQPYVGELRMFAGNFAPAGWMLCEGQLLPISENETLFNLIGTTFGGDGESTFGLPDLRGRLPIHQGKGLAFAETGGTETVTLTVNQLPTHNHVKLASSDTATSFSAVGTVPAAGTAATISPYGSDAPRTTLVPSTLSALGGSQPHENFQPYLCVNFIISLFGIFPSQS